MTWIGLSYLLGSYFRHFDNLDETYGPLGAAIGLYVWFYLSGFAILVGGEINFLLGELKNHRTPKSSNLAHTHSNNLNEARLPLSLRGHALVASGSLPCQGRQECPEAVLRGLHRFFGFCGGRGGTG